ncbi:MAG TPA: protein kinase [Bryobacteraceae bacterium]|nr:protein kinase [Bryobacteraceae bacterium]
MKSIGKYQVIEELGAGPTGKTYRARDSFRHRELAVKVLDPVPGLSTEGKEQFCAYLGSCAELTHRHIAKVLDLGEVDEGIFIATEWRSGQDLTKFLAENPDLTLDQKLGIIAQVAEGLGFAHSRGVAHGNLKPSNLFIDASRDASILDFGIAKWLAALLEAGGRPQGLVASYLAPEQVLGQPFDARSDIFALGLMLYECAAGKYPFSGDPGLVPRDIVHTEAQPLRQINPQAPEELETLVTRALHKDPQQRLQTAEEFASGLYIAAQHLRRAAAAALEPAPSSPPSSDLHLAMIPPALSPQASIPQMAPEPAPEREPVATPMDLSSTASSQPAPSEAPPRERPQDAESEARPWTARSYAAVRETPRDTPPRSSPPSVTDLRRPAPLTAPEPFVPPQSFLPPPPMPEMPIPAKPHKFGKGVLVAVAGLVLAAVIFGTLVSRQNLRASQNRSHPAPAAAVEPVPEIAKPVAPREQAPPPPVHEVKPAEPQVSAPANTEASAKQILNGPVRTLWESGRYAQALLYVNQVLASDPTNEAAQSWKKKIREAQAAEAALK